MNAGSENLSPRINADSRWGLNAGLACQGIRLDGESVSPNALWACARAAGRADAPQHIQIMPDALARIADAAETVASLMVEREVVYGVNTGFGKFSEVRIPRESLLELQGNIIRSHACGVGEELPREIVMAMWLKQINAICTGHSGVRIETVRAILRALDAGILACIPSRGSVGASGDLSPAAHAVRALLGEGWCTVPEDGGFVRMTAEAALDHFGLDPLDLGPKEGLSLINGTSLTTALAVKAWYEANVLVQTANLASALSLAALRGRRSVLDPRLLRSHRHPGTAVCGAEVAEWLGGHLEDADHPPIQVQDAYSLRCAPQVHGAVWEEVRQAEEVLAREINSAADNPLVFPDDGEIVSGGNFHAIQPARVSDRLSSALATLGAISERRTNKLVGGCRVSGIPMFLTENGGLQSGFMMAQVTAAALVSESKSLSFPASVDSIPTNCDKEDHVSMGPAAGFKAVRIAEHIRFVLAIELLAAAQALDLAPQRSLPPRLRAVHSRIRDEVPMLTQDRALSEDFAVVARLIEEEALIAL